MKRLLSLTIIAASFAFAFVACKDDFNEEDFLRVQSELKLKQDEVIRQRIDSASEEAVKEYIAAANEAGDLLAVSLVVRENGNALEGVTVTLSSGTPNEIASGRAKATTTGTTDASGMVVFDRVTIGAGTAVFSKQGYVTATAIYDFGLPENPVAIQVSTPNGSTVTKYVPPRKKFEEAAVSMISATPSSSSTATITGHVTIENDLTNTTPEVPAGIVLRANLTNLITNDQGFFKSYTLADNSSLGRATIAADGTYTMVVPATASGTKIDFIVPNIESTCRMAVNGYDDGTGNAIALPTPEYRNVPTTWGPQVGTTTFVPTVVGARVQLPAAPAAGSGLSFDFTPVPMPLRTGIIDLVTDDNLGDDNNNTVYRIASRGTFTAPYSTPTVTITGGGGAGATATATLQAVVTELVVSNRGANYTPMVDLELWAKVEGAADEKLSTYSDLITDQGRLPVALDLNAIDGDNGGFGGDDTPLTLVADKVYTEFYIKVVPQGNVFVGPATVTATTKVDLKQVEITLGGAGYTSAPTFSFSAGNPVIETREFKMFWNITPVMTAGTDYAVLPDMTIDYPQSATQNGFSVNEVRTFNPNNIEATAAAVSLQSQLSIMNGDVVKKFPALTVRTNFRSTTQPSVRITNVTPTNARLSFAGNAINATTGQITAAPTVPQGGAGVGYNTKLIGQIVPAIEGAPGSGATLSINYNSDNYIPGSMEWRINNGNPTTFTITNAGSGYLPNLNRKDWENASLPSTLNGVQAGKAYVQNFSYGTGFRTLQLN